MVLTGITDHVFFIGTENSVVVSVDFGFGSE